MSHHATRGRSRLPGPINVPEPYPPRWKFDIDRPKKVADIPDDDFIGGVLDSKWTVTDGSPGTVDLKRTSGTVYDLVTRPSWLLTQVDTSGAVRIRQNYELPSGKSIVLKFSYTLSVDGTPGIANNEYNIGIGLNTSDTYLSGTNTKLIMDIDTNAWRIAVLSSGQDRSTPSSGGGSPMATTMYFRIIRDGLDYYSMWSQDGAAWFQFAKQTFGSALDRLWVFCEANASIPDPICVHAFDWIRLGGDGVDPW